MDEVSGPDEPDEFGLHHPRFQAGFSAMVWLADQGYLQFEDTIRQEALDQVVLTRRGFLLLSSRSALEPQEPESNADTPLSVRERSQQNIARLREALREGSSAGLRRCVHYLLSQPGPDSPGAGGPIG